MSVWRLAWIALSCALLAGAAWLVATDGARLDTRLADLAPRSSAPGPDGPDGPGGMNAPDVELADELSAAADAWAAMSLRFLLESDALPDDTARSLPTDAAQALRERLRAIEGMEVVAPERRQAILLERLTPHRFSLLPDDMAAAVDAGERERLVDRALDALYAPSAAPRPLPIEQDPLNGFGRWLDQRLPGGASSEAVLIEAHLAPVAEGPDDRAVVAAVEAAVADVAEAYPDARLARTGVPLFAAEAADASRRDIDRISLGSLLGLLLLLLPAFRAFRPLVMPIVSILVGASTGALLVWLVHGSMHVLTLVFGATLIGIVIDYSIHAYAHAGAGAREPQRLRRALTLGLLTSALGYAALGLSSVDALARVALFSVGGLIGAWLTVLAWLPDGRDGGSAVHLGFLRWPVSALERVGRLLRHGLLDRRYGAMLASLGIAAAIVLLSSSDDDPRRLIDLSPALIEDARRIASTSAADPTLLDADVARRLLVQGEDLDAVYEMLAALERGLPDAELPSVRDWLPAPARMAADRDRAAWLLAADGPAAEVMEALGEADGDSILEPARETLAADERAPLRHATLFTLPELALPPLLAVAPDGTAAALALLPSDLDRAALQTALEAVRAGPGAASVRLLDSVADTEAELGRQRRSALRLLLGAVLAIAAAMLLVYGRANALSAVAVPASAILCTLAVLALAGVPLTLFHAVGLFLVLGLGMDYAIFLGELDGDAASTTRAAIVLSAATSLLSFGLLASSGIPVARFVGQTVFIGNAFNLVFTFVLLAVRERPGTVSA